MDFNHVPADVRWAIANWPENTERGAVTRFCERHGISRSVFYKIRAQVRELGPVGATEPGSRRPHHSPSRTDPAVLEHALAVRIWLVERGLDAGPLSVADWMSRQGLTAPSRATLARAFAAAGVSKPEPRKRPRAANRRFVYPAPNCCWQIDAFAWSLADGTHVAIHQVIDDHSRMAVATLVADGETARAAVLVVSTAVRRWGVPQRLLWRDRFVAEGIVGLDDEPRSGRPKVVDDAAILAATLEPPPEYLAVTHWSTRLLGRQLRVGDATVARAWRRYGIKPCAARRSSSQPTRAGGQGA